MHKLGEAREELKQNYNAVLEEVYAKWISEIENAQKNSKYRLSC